MNSWILHSKVSEILMKSFSRMTIESFDDKAGVVGKVKAIFKREGSAISLRGESKEIAELSEKSTKFAEFITRLSGIKGISTVFDKEGINEFFAKIFKENIRKLPETSFLSKHTGPRLLMV